MEPYSKYATIEGNVLTAVTDQDMGLSAKLVHAERCLISTNNTITVKFNLTTNDAMTIAANTTATIENLYIDEIFVSNASGSTAAVKILAVGK